MSFNKIVLGYYYSSVAVRTSIGYVQTGVAELFSLLINNHRCS